ncbi:MAG: VOC family protein [Defluviitaleaceae bacterium]|nr:VOC family protein [Defluviitaleaceae bacterium]
MISHITFVVKDLEQSAWFWRTIFGAEEVYASSAVKYFLVNDLWVALNLGEPHARRNYNHIAFQIKETEMDEYLSRINKVGAEIKPGRPRKANEGASIYFYDFDNNLFELHTGILTERLEKLSKERD